MTKEALTLALEALERLDGWLALRYGSGLTPQEKQTVTAIKEALAQPEQEPVACVVPHGATMRLEWASVDAAHNAKIGPLYTTPPQRKPLTDEEIGAILEGVNAYGTRLYTFARAIEAKLKEKNT